MNGGLGGRDGETEMTERKIVAIFPPHRRVSGCLSAERQSVITFPVNDLWPELWTHAITM